VHWDGAAIGCGGAVVLSVLYLSGIGQERTAGGPVNEVVLCALKVCAATPAGFVSVCSFVAVLEIS
jgi:hypothetical protein